MAVRSPMFLFNLWRVWRRRRSLVVSSVALSACAAPGGFILPTTIVRSEPWGPLQPTYNSQVRAWAQGTFENRGNSAANVAGEYRDPNNDGNDVYVEVQYEGLAPKTTFSCTGWGGTFSCGSGSENAWSHRQTFVTVEKNHTNGQGPIFSATAPWDMAFQILATDSAIRAKIYSCAQFGWPVPNQCATAIISWAY